MLSREKYYPWKDPAGIINYCLCLFQLQFIEASGLKDFHLLGLSLGALVSAAYATQHGDRIASLTVMCPPGKSELRNSTL